MLGVDEKEREDAQHPMSLHVTSVAVNGSRKKSKSSPLRSYAGRWCRDKRHEMVAPTLPQDFFALFPAFLLTCRCSSFHIMPATGREKADEAKKEERDGRIIHFLYGFS